MNNLKSLANVDSPCIRHCCLDPDDICLGCFRHIDEITGWSEANHTFRQEILQRCQDRRKQRDKQMES